MSKLDKETDEVYTRGKKLREVINHDGWEVVEDVFMERVDDLQALGNLDRTAEDSLELQVASREVALEYMMDFWNELKGMVEQHETNFNKKAMQNIVRKDE